MLQQGATAKTSFVLLNLGLSDVPLHLSMDTTQSITWHYFSFTDVPEDIVHRSTLIPSATSVSLVLPANKRLVSLTSPGRGLSYSILNPVSSSDQGCPLSLQLKSPKPVHNSVLPLGPATEVATSVLVKLDGLRARGRLLHQIEVKAILGVARLYAPRTMQTVTMVTKPGSAVSSDIPLKNIGNISLNIVLKLQPPRDSITVTPSRVTLAPNTESTVMIIYTAPRCQCREEASLIMRGDPDGPSYKIKLIMVSSREDRQERAKREEAGPSNGVPLLAEAIHPPSPNIIETEQPGNSPSQGLFSVIKPVQKRDVGGSTRSPPTHRPMTVPLQTISFQDTPVSKFNGKLPQYK